MRPSRRYADIGAVVGLVLVLVIPQTVRAGQTQTPQDEPLPQALGLSQGLDPGTTVPFDLTRGRFLQALPFDVQFYVLSPVKDQVTGVTGSYGRTCADAVTPGSGRANLSPGRFLTTGNPATRSVEISVPALSPNRQYCFVFTLTLKADEVKLRQMVAEQLDLHLRDLYRNEASLVTEAPFDAFRADLLSGIRDAARDLQLESGLSSLRLTVPPDSFFAPPPAPRDDVPPAQPDLRPQITQRQGTPSSAIRLKERTEFARLLSMQLGKANALTTFSRSASLASSELARLRAMAPFSRIVAQLRANITQPLVRQRLPTDDALRFEAVPSDRDDAQTAGIAPDQIAAAVDLEKVWDPAEFAPRVLNLDATLAELQAFRDIVRDLATPPWEPLRDAAGLGPSVQGAANNPNAVTAAEFTSVGLQVERVRQAMEQARLALIGVQSLLTDRSAAIVATAARITADLVEVITITGDTTGSWDTRARSYVSADVGVAWSNPIQSFFFYVGANFYLGPVNKKAPLRWSEPGNFRKRFAFMAGAPINAFDQAQTQTTLTAGGTTLKGVLGDRPLLLGAGLRLNDLVRATGGTVLFRVNSPNPLIATERLDYAWFLAFSIDWDLKGMFSQLQPTGTGRPSRLFRP